MAKDCYKTHWFTIFCIPIVITRCPRQNACKGCEKISQRPCDYNIVIEVNIKSN